MPGKETGCLPVHLAAEGAFSEVVWTVVSQGSVALSVAASESHHVWSWGFRRMDGLPANGEPVHPLPQPSHGGVQGFFMPLTFDEPDARG